MLLLRRLAAEMRLVEGLDVFTKKWFWQDPGLEKFVASRVQHRLRRWIIISRWI